MDRYNFDDVQADDSWTAVWQSAVALDTDGWTAEFRISLKFGYCLAR